MLKIEKSIVINAPVDEVFAYTSDPTHTPQFFTGVDEVRDIRRLPNGGFASTTRVKIAGFHTEMTGETTEFVPNKRFVSRSNGGLEDATITVTFEPVEGDKTRVTCVEQHDIHGGILGDLGEFFLDGYLNHAAEMTQATLKARIEAGVPAALAR